MRKTVARGVIGILELLNWAYFFVALRVLYGINHQHTFDLRSIILKEQASKGEWLNELYEGEAFNLNKSWGLGLFAFRPPPPGDLINSTSV